jgi:hypothetical protein
MKNNIPKKPVPASRDSSKKTGPGKTNGLNSVNSSVQGLPG